jgi:hypothetical protein
MDYLKPLENYLKARDLQRQGMPELAAGCLEKAFGSIEPNGFLRRNLDRALDETKAAGSLVLEGIFGEMKWMQRQTVKPRKSHE